MNNRELARKMRDLVAECRGLGPAEELALLNDWLGQELDAAFAHELKITKAKLLAQIGRESEAILLLDACSWSPEVNESAAYFAAEVLVDCHRVREAEAYLERAEQHIVRAGSEYFKNCIYLLHAYCAARVGDACRARALLEMVTDRDEDRFWLKTSPAISFMSVEDMIKGIA